MSNGYYFSVPNTGHAGSGAGTSTTSTGSVTSVSALELYDMQDKPAYTQENFTGMEEINIGNVPAGVYFLWITLDGKMESLPCTSGNGR